VSDSLILHALRDRKRFNTLRASVPDEMLSPDSANLLAWFNLYFQTYPEHARVEVEPLQALVKLRADPNAGKAAVDIVLHLVGGLAHEPPADALMGVNNMLRERDLSGRAAAILSSFNRGDEVDLSYELQQLALETRREMQSGGVSSWADGSIKDYLAADADTGGLKITAFGDILASRLKGIRSGDNVAVVMPTDKGKTSLLCRLMEGWSAQRLNDFLQDGRPILYLVNEGTAERITVRWWQTALNLSREKMYEMSNNGTLDAAYIEKVGGRNAVIIKNIHGKNLSQVAQIIEHFNPYLVITDMTGRIKAVSNRGGGANDIGQLEEVWNGLREEAAIQDFAHVGTIQVSAEGFNMLYPPLSAMQNSKTGIQTTLDLVIMGGALNDYPGVRGISTPKNKLAMSGMKSENEFQTVFDPIMNTWTMQREGQ